jgi:hypothetical protein
LRWTKTIPFLRRKCCPGALKSLNRNELKET